MEKELLPKVQATILFWVYQPYKTAINGKKAKRNAADRTVKKDITKPVNTSKFKTASSP